MGWPNNLKENKKLRPTFNVPSPRATTKLLTGDQNTKTMLLQEWKNLKRPRRSWLSSSKMPKNKLKMPLASSPALKSPRLVSPLNSKTFKLLSKDKPFNLPTLTRSNVTSTKIWLPKYPSMKKSTLSLKPPKRTSETSPPTNTNLSSHTMNPKTHMLLLRRNGRTSRTKTVSSPTNLPLVESPSTK